MAANRRTRFSNASSCAPNEDTITSCLEHTFGYDILDVKSSLYG